MNYSLIDLDIKNYDNDDLEIFFNLSKNYNEIDVDTKESSIRNKILNAVSDKSFQDRFLNFLDEAKRMLIERFKKSKLLVGDGSNFVINKTDDSIYNFTQPINSFVTETAPGVLNKLRRRTTTTSLALNTAFCDCNSNSSSDCFFTLSYTLKNVVSISLISVELPDSIFLVSNSAMTNRIYIWVPVTDASGVIVVPDGCYNYQTMASSLENAINKTLNSGTAFQVIIDSASKRTTIINTLNHEFDIYFTFCDQISMNTIKQKNLGWILGFREDSNFNQSSYTSESLFNPLPTEYLYFVLNDYYISNSSNLIAFFNDTYLDRNILAKIPYSNTNFQTSYYSGITNILSPPRKYFGPINIKKLGLQLLDSYGVVVDLNGMEFSFTLEVEIAYDI